MSVKVEAVTAVPAFIILILAINLALFSFATPDANQKQIFVVVASGMFIGGLVLALWWVILSVLLRVRITRRE